MWGVKQKGKKEKYWVKKRKKGARNSGNVRRDGEMPKKFLRIGHLTE